MVSRSCLREVLPYVAMISMEFLDVGVTTLLKAAMTRGESQYVMIVYSNAIAALILLLSYYVLERKRGWLTFRLLCRFFFLGLIGVTVMQIFALNGINYSSPALASTLNNMVPPYTFIPAVIFRFEKLKIRSSSTQAKIVGTLVCISGALVATLHKGKPLWKISSSLPSLLFSKHPPPESVKRKNWALGAVFLLTAGICVSFWNGLQAAILKEYPWEITIAAFNVLSASFQAAMVSLIVERRHPSAWRINSNIELIATVYLAIVGNVVTFTVHTWCIRQKGPLFMVMFKPLGIVISTIATTFQLGNTLYLGSVIGGIIIVAGFYSVMWGRANEEQRIEPTQDDGLGSTSHRLTQEEKRREDIQDAELVSSS